MNDLILKSCMRKYGDTNETLASALGIHPHTLYMKMRESSEDARKQQFTQAEIRFIAKRYELSADKVMEIFFD